MKSLLVIVFILYISVPCIAHSESCDRTLKHQNGVVSTTQQPAGASTGKSATIGSPSSSPCGALSCAEEAALSPGNKLYNKGQRYYKDFKDRPDFSPNLYLEYMTQAADLGFIFDYLQVLSNYIDTVPSYSSMSYKERKSDVEQLRYLNQCESIIKYCTAALPYIEDDQIVIIFKRKLNELHTTVKHLKIVAQARANTKSKWDKLLADRSKIKGGEKEPIKAFNNHNFGTIISEFSGDPTWAVISPSLAADLALTAPISFCKRNFKEFVYYTHLEMVKDGAVMTLFFFGGGEPDEESGFLFKVKTDFPTDVDVNQILSALKKKYGKPKVSKENSVETCYVLGAMPLATYSLQHTQYKYPVKNVDVIFSEQKYSDPKVLSPLKVEEILKKSDYSPSKISAYLSSYSNEVYQENNNLAKNNPLEFFREYGISPISFSLTKLSLLEKKVISYKVEELVKKFIEKQSREKNNG